MSELPPPGSASPDQDRLLEAMSWARKLARMVVRVWRIRSSATLMDAEQTACEVVLAKWAGWDAAQGPFEGYLWKPVVGAVKRQLRRELGGVRAGFEDGLDEASEFQAPGTPDDPFGAEDVSDLDALKAACRRITFRQVLGDTRAALQAQPENDALRAQVFEALGAAVGELGERERRIIELRYWQELTWPEIGERMGLSDRQVKRIDGDVRDRLEGGLRRRGVEEPPPSVSL